MHFLSSPQEMINMRLSLNVKDNPTQALKSGFEARISSLQILKQGVPGFIFFPMKQELGFFVCEIKWEDQIASQVLPSFLISGYEMWKNCVPFIVHVHKEVVFNRARDTSAWGHTQS